jgi:hypothetical protein
MSGPFVPGGLRAAKDVNALVDLFFELVVIDEAVDLHRAEK